MPIYYCNGCGKGLEYNLQKPEKCSRCQKDFTVVEAVDYDKIKEKRLARENKIRKLREIEAEEVEETEVEDVEFDDNIDIPEVSREDVLVEGVVRKEEVRKITVADILNNGMVQDLPRGQPENISTKDFMEQFAQQNGSKTQVSKSHSVKKK